MRVPLVLVIVGLLGVVYSQSPCLTLLCKICVQNTSCKFVIPFIGEGFCMSKFDNTTLSIQLTIRSQKRCAVYQTSLEGGKPTARIFAMGAIDVESIIPKEGSNPEEKTAVVEQTVLPTGSLLNYRESIQMEEQSSTMPSTSAPQLGTSFTGKLDFDSIFKGGFNVTTLQKPFFCPQHPYKESLFAKAFRSQCRSFVLMKKVLKYKHDPLLAYYNDGNPTKGQEFLCSYILFLRQKC